MPTAASRTKEQEPGLPGHRMTQGVRAQAEGEPGVGLEVGRVGFFQTGNEAREVSAHVLDGDPQASSGR